MVYKDQLFRMHYDNRRLLVLPNNNSSNPSLLDSNPYKISPKNKIWGL
jgi:hypothetical protein